MSWDKGRNLLYRKKTCKFQFTICTLTNLLSAWILTPRFQLMWENTLGSQGYCTLPAWQTTNLKWGGNWKYVWLEQLYFKKKQANKHSGQGQGHYDYQSGFPPNPKTNTDILRSLHGNGHPCTEKAFAKVSQQKKINCICLVAGFAPVFLYHCDTTCSKGRDVPAKQFWCLNICRWIYWLN